MNLEKFGSTLILLVAVLFLVAGAKMAVKIGDPYIRRVSTSLADALASA